MVAQSSAYFLIFRGLARQHGRGFSALVQILGRTAILFVKNYIVPAAKKIGQIYLELLLQRLEKLSVDKKNSKHLQKMLEQKQLEISWEVEKRNPIVDLEVPFLEKVVRKSVALAKTFFWQNKIR